MNKYKGLQNGWIVSTFSYNEETKKYDYDEKIFIFIGAVGRYDHLLMLFNRHRIDERNIFKIENTDFSEFQIKGFEKSKLYGSKYFIYDSTKKNTERENLNFKPYPIQLDIKF